VFGLFLVHKISIYKYKTKWEKEEKEKEKEKGFSALVGRGEFRPSRAWARARGRASWPSTAHGRETAPWSRAHAPETAGGETASAADGGGVNRPTRGEKPPAGGFNGDSPPVARFLGIGQVPKHKERLASLRVGPILLEVTGRELAAVGWRSSVAGVVAGEALVAIGGRAAVLRICGDVVKLPSLVNCSPNNQRGGEELTGEEGGAAVLARLSSGRGRRVAEAGAGRGGARGSPFIGARGEGSDGVRRAPVRFTVVAVMANSGDDGTSRGRRWRAGTWSQRRRTERCPTSLCG
jgi:hypothetical protein